MALGKNMKVDRLIPLSDDNNSEIEGFDNNIDLSESNVEISVEEELSSIMDLNLEGEIDKEEIKSELQPQAQIVYENVEEETIKIIFTPSRRKTQKRILINIEGSLTINNVELLYSKVNVVFENYDFVEVTMTNVTDIDLTVIQLFHAIRVAYWPQNKFISINAEFSREDRKLLNTCGFTEFQTQKTD
jgi:hypothetical protein